MTRRSHTFAGWAQGEDVLVNAGTGSGDQLNRVIRASGADINADAAAAMGGAAKGARMTAPASVPVSLGWDNLTVFNNFAAVALIKLDSLPTVDAHRLFQPIRAAGSTTVPRFYGQANGVIRFVDGAHATIAETAAQSLAAWQAGFKIQEYCVKGTTTANGQFQGRITRLLDSVVILDTGLLVGNAQTDGFRGFEVGRAPSVTTWAGTTDVALISLEDAATGLIDVPSSNQAPTSGIAASKVADVEPGSTVTLTLSESDDVAVTTRTFRQVSGPTAVVTGSGLSRTVEAPYTLTGGNMVFGYKVGDAQGAESAEATISLELLPADWRIGTGVSAKPLRFRIGPA